MSVNFGSGKASPNENGINETNETNEMVEYDINARRGELMEKYSGSAEVDAIAGEIYVDEPETIVKFGKGSAEKIAECSDIVLNSMSMDKINESGETLNALARIMDRFDLKEIEEDNKGVFQRFFGSAKKRLDGILHKYNSMGDEVDKIYTQLKTYESEINQSNKRLQELFEANVGYYEELVKYILAGEQGIGELDAYIEQRKNELENSGDASIQFELASLEKAKELLEQRVHDLRISENVALQSIPMIKTIQFSNLNLIRKINSAFIITLPVFKQALAQAIMLKRQRIQAEALSALDEKTNELLIKNAQNTAEQSRMTAELASGNSVRMETLENTWRTIMSGVEETKRIQENAQKRREDEVKRLENIKKEFDAAFAGGK